MGGDSGLPEVAPDLPDWAWGLASTFGPICVPGRAVPIFGSLVADSFYQSLGDGSQNLDCNLGVVVHKGRKLAGVHQESGNVGFGRDGGVAGLVGDQTQLTDDVTG